MAAVKRFRTEVWNTVSLHSLYYHDEGYFIARFRTGSQREEIVILQNGPYSVYSMLLFIRKWSPEFVRKEDTLRVMPILVNFLGLPLLWWGQRSLSKISSGVGISVTSDECMTMKIKGVLCEGPYRSKYHTKEKGGNAYQRCSWQEVQPESYL